MVRVGKSIIIHLRAAESETQYLPLRIEQIDRRKNKDVTALAVHSPSYCHIFKLLLVLLVYDLEIVACRLLLISLSNNGRK